MKFHTTFKIDADVYESANTIHKADDIKSLAKERESSILSQDEVIKQIQEGKLACISKVGAYKKVYAYVAENANPLFKTQFYNEDGELLFTYPWNGDLKMHYGGISGRIEFPGFEIRQMRHIFKINCFATESGKIMIESTSTMAPLGPVIPSDKKEVNVTLYNAGAKEVMFGGGVINKNNLPKELQPAVKKSGNLNRSELFSILAVSENADESLKKINEHSYMI